MADRARASLTDQAYERLKWKILTMEIGPGAFLKELDLCADLGFKRAPVHEALQRLRHDRLVDVLPRKGAVVRALSRRDIAHLIEARLPVETAIARLAATRGATDGVGRLGGMLMAGPRLIAANDREGLIRLDRAFHAGLAEAAGNPVLASLAEDLHQRSTMLWHLSVSDRRTYEEVQRQHEAILAAVVARDPDRAAAAVTAHLGHFSPD